MAPYGIIFLLSFAASLNLPREFKRCRFSDKRRDECLRDAIQDALVLLRNGLQEFNFPKLEPVEVEGMTIGNGNEAVHLDQYYKNVKIYGITEVKIDNVRTEDDGNILKLFLNGTIPEIRMTANYNITGKILLIQISGSGKCTIKLSNVFCSPAVIAEHYDVNGIGYSKVQQFITTTIPEKVDFDFENLFGDNDIGKEINKLINDEWEIIFHDLRPAIETALGAIFKDITNIIYTKVPFNDLFPQ